ncbi:MAG: nucleotidyltransferase domain-containing protein [bacterium]
MKKISKAKIKEIAKKYDINAVYLFGSQVTGAVHKNSDYDFAVQFSETVAGNKYFDLKLKIMGEMMKLAKSDKVDLVILNEEKSPLSLKNRIIKDGKILFVNDDIKRSRMETRIMSLYRDRQYYFKRHIKESLENIAKNGIL